MHRTIDLMFSCSCTMFHDRKVLGVFVCFFVLWYAGLSLLWPLLLWSTGSGRTGSVAMAHGPSRSAACGIFPDRGMNPCPLHRQADSQPLCHEGSLIYFLNQLSAHSLSYIFPYKFWAVDSLISFSHDKDFVIYL